MALAVPAGLPGGARPSDRHWRHLSHAALRRVSGALHLQKDCQRSFQPFFSGRSIGCDAPGSLVRAAAAAAAAAAIDTPPPQLPLQTACALDAAADAVLDDSISHPLVDTETGVEVVLVPITFFAPRQERLVQRALAAVPLPAAVLIEQPPPSGGGDGPPAWLQALLDWDATGRGGGEAGGAAAALHRLLSAVSPPPDTTSRVGRDVLDPWEPLGFYGGLDLARDPTAAADLLRLTGCLPGGELAAAAHAALSGGVPLLCLDAPLRLQAQWVSSLLRGFQADEQALAALQPGRELAACEAMLHPAAAEWDALLRAVAQSTHAAAAAAAESKAQQGQDGAAAGEALAHAERARLLLFKSSRATAAALLPPVGVPQALQHLQRLQPLKWAHAALRERHMARMIREACTAAARSAGLSPPVASRPAAGAASTMGAGTTTSSTTSSTNNSSSMEASAPPVPLPGQRGRVTLLAVVGRHHVPGLRAMWDDPQSPLWTERMPRAFAPSVIEEATASTSEGVTAGGSSASETRLGVDVAGASGEGSRPER